MQMANWLNKLSKSNWHTNDGNLAVVLTEALCLTRMPFLFQFFYFVYFFARCLCTWTKHFQRDFDVIFHFGSSCAKKFHAVDWIANCIFLHIFFSYFHLAPWFRCGRIRVIEFQMFQIRAHCLQLASKSDYESQWKRVRAFHLLEIIWCGLKFLRRLKTTNSNEIHIECMQKTELKCYRPQGLGAMIRNMNISSNIW